MTEQRDMDVVFSDARSALGWMKAQQLITSTRDGKIKLRSRGRILLALLQVIDQLGDRAGDVLHEARDGLTR